MAADSQNCYVSSFSLYLCKEADVPQLNGFGHDIVMKMARPFLKMHRHVFFDNFFMSTKLMDHLLAQDTYACGTIWSNRKDLPPCAKNKLKQGEKVSAQRGSLVFTKWHDKRDISFLSTNVLPSEAPRIVQRRKNGRNIDIEKPRVADVYTAHMGGVDRANQLRSFYFAGYSSRKWYRYIFWFLFNLSFSNQLIVLTKENRSDRWSASGLIWRNNWSMVSANEKGNKDLRKLHIILWLVKNMSQFMFMEGRENAFSASKSSDEHPKDTRLRHVLNVVCARSRCAEHVTMNTPHKHCESFISFLWTDNRI